MGKYVKNELCTSYKQAKYERIRGTISRREMSEIAGNCVMRKTFYFEKGEALYRSTFGSGF